jgi:hypothetical protein
VQTKFGKCPVGSFLSYQVTVTESSFKVFLNIDSVARVPIRNGHSIFPRFPLKNIDELLYPDNLSTPEQEFVDQLTLDENEINNIESNTRKQAICEVWKAERKYRFTASQFHLISRRQRNHDNFAKTLMHPKDISSVYLEHGKKYEPVALQEYQKVMFNRKTPVKVFPSGFVICQNCGILGASPDGKVIDPGCLDSFGLAEVKCPQTKFSVTPLDAALDPKFYLDKVSDNECKLRTNHQYYAQVQGQMGVTGARWTDFIVYTSKGIHIERIVFDSAFWSNLKDKLVLYYFTHFLKLAVSDKALISNATDNSIA